MLAILPTDRVFILTGAGVSAESGIPTFRDAGGLWRNYRFEEVASPHAWRRDPRLVCEFYSMRRRVAAEAKPNPAHFALATLERALQDRLFLCTQNVDSLHEQAGSRHVVHMHGELFKSRCDACSRPPFDDIKALRVASGASPVRVWRRDSSTHLLVWRTALAMDVIYQALDRCTIFMAIGTSGMVEPAASFVAHVRSRALTVYVGPEEPANASSFTECHSGQSGRAAAGFVWRQSKIAESNKWR